MDSPLLAVSVIFPACNEGEWVRRTVEAVRGHRDGHDIEIIVVDDGSTDGSCDFLRQGYEDPAVHLVEGAGTGSHRARNLGALQAQYSTLVFLDGHVLPDDGWLDEICGILADPTTGLAGVAIRSVDVAESVGFTYRFMDETINVGWSPKLAETPYEAPCIIACCMGVRRDTFWELGGFDGGCVRWGVEDVELSFRAWWMGYRCVVSPRAQVAHRFKQGADRGFTIGWEDFDYNLLRCVLTHFSPERVHAIVASLKRHESFPRSLQKILDDTAFWERRRLLWQKYVRDDRWYFQRFATELAPFEARLQEIRKKEGLVMQTTPGFVRVCWRCGANNAGPQTNCLMCQAPLIAPTQVATTFAPAVPPPPPPVSPGIAVPPSPPAPPAMDAAPAQVAPVLCPRCGQAATAGQQFCAGCGGPLPQAAAPPTPAPFVPPAATSVAPTAFVSAFAAPATLATSVPPTAAPAFVSPFASLTTPAGSAPPGSTYGMPAPSIPPATPITPVASAPPAPRVCIKCAAPLAPGTRFCNMCGAAQDAPPTTPTAPPTPMPTDPATINCPRCGAPANPDRRFCAQCGSPMRAPAETAAPPVAPASTNCRRCGAEVKSGAVFCPSCGFRQ